MVLATSCLSDGPYYNGCFWRSAWGKVGFKEPVSVIHEIGGGYVHAVLAGVAQAGLGGGAEVGAQCYAKRLHRG